MWADLLVTLAPSEIYAMLAPLFLPMNNNTDAYYTAEFQAVGPGAGQIDFQRCAIPTEKAAAWQTMNAATIAMARGAGYVHKTFIAEGGVGGDHPPRGYQRILLTNTDATALHWTTLRVRIWSHLSGS